MACKKLAQVLFSLTRETKLASPVMILAPKYQKSHGLNRSFHLCSSGQGASSSAYFPMAIFQRKGKLPDTSKMHHPQYFLLSPSPVQEISTTIWGLLFVFSPSNSTLSSEPQSGYDCTGSCKWCVHLGGGIKQFGPSAPHCCQRMGYTPCNNSTQESFLSSLLCSSGMTTCRVSLKSRESLSKPLGLVWGWMSRARLWTLLYLSGRHEAHVSFVPWNQWAPKALCSELNLFPCVFKLFALYY